MFRGSRNYGEKRTFDLDEKIEEEKPKESLEQLSGELTEENIALLLEGPGDPPSHPATMMGILAYGAEYVREGGIYRQKVEKYNRLLEKHGGFLAELKEKEGERKKEHNKHLIRKAVNWMIFGAISTGATLLNLSNRPQSPEEFEQRRIQDSYQQEMKAYNGYKDRIFWITDREIDGRANSDKYFSSLRKNREK